jgi:FAD/FMN-containing dehydrogenase
VDQKLDPDLFKALKGAGPNNFGIVVSFTLETIPLPNPAGIWFSSKTFSSESIPALRSARHEWVTQGVVEDFDTGGYDVAGYYGAYDMSMALFQHIHTSHSSVRDPPKVYSLYHDIKALDGTEDTRIMPMSNVTELISQSNPNGVRNTYATFTYKPTPELEEKLFEILDEGIAKVKHVPGIGAFMPLHPLSRRSMSQMSNRGGNSLGLQESDGPLVIALQAWMWLNSENDALIFQTTKEIVRRSEAVAKEMGLWHRYKYMNYAEKWQADDIYEGYGEANHEKLKQLQKKLDPEGVFTKGGLCGGYFMLNEKVDRSERAKDEL